MMAEDQLNLLNLSKVDEDTRIKTLNEVEEVCKHCYKCDLSKSRTQIVFSDGNKNAKTMLIGEAPGRNEDLKGKPFVGRAGQLLDKILLSQDITRERDIYICNTVKCRPPENRVPTNDEKAACREYLDAQLSLIRPAIILLAGATSVKSMLDTKLPISKIRGQWFDGPLDSKIMPIFHPSYLLRNESKEPGSPKWLMWEDIKEIKRAMNEIEK